MKKLAFTLAELLIALGLVGIISAITAPMIGDLMPNQEKMKVLKAYKTITDINEELLNDPSLYWTPAESNCIGFLCLADEPLENPYATRDNSFYVGGGKYPNLLLDRIEYDIRSSDKALKQWAITTDGIFIQAYTNTIDLSKLIYKAVIIVDLNESINNMTENDIYSKNLPNKAYGDSNCKKPDRFVFNVDESGRVTGGDPLTKVYLANPHYTNKKRTDYKLAEESD